jgi:uncharacterized protein YfiM (DUF2279 family)
LIDDALGRLERGDDQFASFIADDRRNYYVQVAVTNDGLLGEAVGNHYLASKDRLGAEALQRLAALGWTLSETGSEDNHTRTWQDWRSGNIRLVTDDLIKTLTDCYEMDPAGPLNIVTGT